MITFLFWNLNGKPLQSLVTELAQEHQVDVLMLAECQIPPEDLLAELNRQQPIPYTGPDPKSQCERIAIYQRFSRRFIKRVSETSKYTFRHLRLPARGKILLGVVHLRSKLFQSGASQTQALTGFCTTVAEAEAKVGHRQTVLVGDWNMNPFEEGMVGAAGLHAVMTRTLAEERKRIIDNQEYLFFYNPMWSCFGDTSAGSPGTYFYRSAEHVSYFWNIFDQVLLRPDVLPWFRKEDLAILERTSTTSLLTEKGVPNRTIASDHLPLLFRLKL